MKCLLALLLLLLAAGCSSKASIQSWQNSFESFTANEANGDPSYLRDPAGASRHKRFAVLGGDSPDGSTDVSGALVGRSTVQGRPWLVFVVATVEDREVQDIRLAMASDDGGKRVWLWSDENPTVLETYNQYHATRWKRFDAVREQPPILPGLFPADEDIYRLDVAGNTAQLVELNSGARWTVVVNSEQQRQ